MSPILLRLADPYLLGAALVLGLVAGGWWLHSSGYSSGTAAKDLEWSEKWERQAAKLAAAKAQSELEAREEEQRRQRAIDDVRNDAEKQIALAQADAAAADLAADGLRDAAQRLAKRTCPSASGAVTAQGGSPASQPGVVFAELLVMVEKAGRAMAAEADRRRVAGAACEQAYSSLTSER